LYTDDQGQNYAKNYSAADMEHYKKRVKEVYIPKAEFLKEALVEQGETSFELTDFGAGAGYLVSAAIETGFDVVGYEASETLVNLGNSMIGSQKLRAHDLTDMIKVIEDSESKVASFIGVLEHLQNPREALEALSRNRTIRYVYFSTPLFSPTVVLESVFDHVMPRHLASGHTHLYTEQSIQHFCDEFGFTRASEWWFGLDICDLGRDVSISLRKESTQNDVLQAYWRKRFLPLIDELQAVLDQAHACSEVHMLLAKA